MRNNVSSSSSGNSPSQPLDVSRHRSLTGSNRQRGSLCFGAAISLVLQFLPSGVVYCLALDTPLTLGCNHIHDTRDFLDLTTIGGYRHGVSHVHAVLWREDQRLFILDRGSAQGTYINGQRLESGKAYELADGDRLVLGTLHADVHFVSPEEIDSSGAI
jgi:hypothetical protein